MNTGAHAEAQPVRPPPERPASPGGIQSSTGGSTSDSAPRLYPGKSVWDG